MSSDADLQTAAELQLCYKMANAPLNAFPYVHFHVENVFPRAFYDALQANLPEPSDMAPISQVRPVKGYDERFVMELGGAQVARLPEQKRDFWSRVHYWLVGRRFGQLVTSRFGDFIQQRFQNQPVRLYDEAMLIQDTTNYDLGPHTDSQSKVLSFLFYLPADDSQRHLGTSIYVPRDPAFRCPGGPHYKRNAFERMWTAPFLPNSLFGFFKSDISFHGVEPVQDENCRRWLLLYDLYADVQPPQQAAPAAAAVPPSLKFTF